MMLQANAEWRRYARLELTPFRLFIIPVVGVLVILAACSGGQPAETRWLIRITNTWFVFCAFWGMQGANLSVVDEVAGGTWDQQRLSHQSAWKLLWGKWLGSTVFSWYGVFWGVVLSLPFGMPWRHVGLLLALMLTGQALGVLFSFANVIRMRQVRRAKMAGLRQGSAVVSGLLVLAGACILNADDNISRVWGDTLVAVCLWLPWPALIAHRLARIELQERVTPVVWLALVAFHTAFVCLPLAGTRSFSGLRLLEVLTIVALAYTYLTGFFERLDTLKLLNLIKIRNWQMLWSQVPVSWLLAIVSVAACCVYALVLSTGGETRAEPGFSVQAIITIVLFGLRDWLLLVFIQLSVAAHKESYGATAFGFSLVYVIVPLLAFLSGFEGFTPFCWSFNLDQAAVWQPLPTLALVTGLTFWRVKKILESQLSVSIKTITQE